jgi:hypothetical protein
MLRRTVKIMGARVSLTQWPLLGWGNRVSHRRGGRLGLIPAAL